MPWNCLTCTYENLNETFLSCEICGSSRAQPIADQSTTDGSQPTCDHSTTDGSRHRGSLKRHRPSTSDTQHQRSITDVLGKRKPRDPRPCSSDVPRLPTKSSTSPNKRSISDVLRPKKSSDFAGRVTVKTGNNDPTSISDSDLHQFAPATFVRDILPHDDAGKLLCLLHADAVSWKHHPWFIFNQWKKTPRTSKGFQLTPSLAPSGASAQGSIYAAAAVSEDTDRRLMEDLQIVASTLADNIAKWRPSKESWVPTIALGNRYKDHHESVGSHSDYLGELGPRPIIVGLALGACRDFVLTNRSSENQVTVRIPMPHNSLVVMWGECQEQWDHAVPSCAESTMIRHPVVGSVRYSLTFRMSRGLLSRPECNCGRPAELKYRGGAYKWLCAGHAPRGDEHLAPNAPPPAQPCNYSTESQWATREAERLATLELETKRGFHMKLNK